MSKVINIGNAKLMLKLPEDTMLITQWNAMWSIWHDHSSDDAMVIYMPDETAIVSIDPASTVALPGSEPMIVLRLSTHRGCSSDMYGTSSSGRGQGRRLPLVEKHYVLSKIDGTARFIYPHAPSSDASLYSSERGLIRWLCSPMQTQSTRVILPRSMQQVQPIVIPPPPPKRRRSVDLSLYPTFKLSDLVGEKEFKKLASKAKTRFRKIMDGCLTPIIYRIQ